MKCIELNQKSQKWRDWRNSGITATDAPVIMGLNPHKTVWRLWAEKTMFIRVLDLSKIPAVKWGNEHEDVAREIYESKTNDILLPFCAEFDKNPVFRASFDGIDREGCPVEIKCPGTKTLNDVKTRGIESDAYKLYWGQVQHQMLVAEADHGHLIFYDHDAEDVIVFRIERDDAFISELLEKATVFYRNIVTRKEPARDPEKDMYIPKGEEQVQEWMHHAQTLVGLDKELQAHKQAIESLQKRMEASKSALIAMMGESEFLADYGGVALTRSIVSGRVDYKAMCLDLLQREPTAAELLPFTSDSKERWLVRVTGCDSQEIIDEETLNEIQENSFETRESLWF